nr:protein kinase, ATP binding site-containing protein [Tanacetum cinerariifolium]
MKQFEHFKISLEAIKSATKDFSKENRIGKGGFGKVYKAEIVHSMDKHENIISLLGYCDECGERILVYEYAANKSLDKYLHSSELTWVRRLNICLGAARGLMSLHNAVGAQQRVLHSDIKSSNILLDENWNAKISDFGLSRLGPANQQITFVVSTTMVGTPGYCDPQYVETGVLRKESDVYSFGVVLFEVLSGRFSTFDKHQDSISDHPRLVRLARKSYEHNTLDEVIHSTIKDEISSDSLEMFITIAYQCSMTESKDRPLMTEVVKALEDALQGHQRIIDRLAVMCLEQKTSKVPALDVNHEFSTFDKHQDSISDHPRAMEHPVGTLNVKVVRVMNLKRALLFFDRACFVKVGLTKDRHPSKKTSMIKSLNPEWNEEFPLVVNDLDVQALEISVWTGQDLPYRMWMHYVPLEVLIPEQQKTLTFDLLKHMDYNHVENNKSYGQLMIELIYKPVTREEVLTYSEEANEIKKPLKVGGWLVVTILEAEDIHITHPFVYVTIQDDRRQTMLAKKSFDPVWNEEVMFSLEKPPTDEILNLELHSSSQISSLCQVTKRGHVNISLADIMKKTRTKEMYHLQGTTSGGRILAVKIKSIMDAYGIWGTVEPRSLGEETDLKKSKQALAFLFQAIPENMVLQMASYTDPKQVWVETESFLSLRLETILMIKFWERLPLKPNSVNILSWRIKLNNLPTRLNLSRRGLELQTILCPSCNLAVESTYHLFFRCSMMKDLYASIAKWWDVNMREFSSFEEWWEWFSNFRLSSKLKMLLEGAFYVAWWLAWNFRNKSIFGPNIPLKAHLFDDEGETVDDFVIDRFSFKGKESRIEGIQGLERIKGTEKMEDIGLMLASQEKLHGCKHCGNGGSNRDGFERG